MPSAPCQWCRRRAAVLVAALTLSAAAHAVSDIVLTDQHGGEDSLGAHRGEVVLVFIVTATGLLNTKFWEEDLREQVEDVTYLRVADIPEEPPVTFERVALKLKIVAPAQVPVMVDMERQWARALDLDTAVPNLLLFNREGQLAARYRGRWHPANVTRVAQRIREIQGDQ